MTLTNRLSIFFLSMLAVVLVGFSAGIYVLADRYLHQQAVERLDVVLNTISGAIEAGPGGVEWEPSNRHLNLDFSLLGDPVVWLVADDNGQLIDRSKGSNTEEFLSNPSISAHLKYSSGENANRVVASWETGRRWFHPDTHLPNHANDSQVGTPDESHLHPALSVTAGVSLSPVNATLRQLAMSLFALSAGIWLTAFFAGRFVCRRALLPVNRMAAAAEEIGATDLSQRLPVITTNDELGGLNRAFNTLLDRLQVAFEQQQRFTGDASHQLRTPLTVILGQIEVALRRERSPQEYRDVLMAAQKKATHLTKMVESLLFLARADSEARPPEREPLNLAIWLPQHLPSWADHARGADISFECSGSDHFSINAHSTLLGELINILLDNACRYSDPGTPIKVRLERSEDAISLSVEDQGCGMNDSDLANLFVPFFRSAEARRLGIEGTGLGLSIAKRLAEGFGGTLKATSRSAHGSCFTIQVPTALPIDTDNCEPRPSSSAQPKLLSSGSGS